MQFRHTELNFSHTQIMGVLNITPDSFSDGGRFNALDLAVQRALKMEGNGATLIDVGGESSRPGAAPISVEEEILRTQPVIEALYRALDKDTIISIDTRNRKCAEAAVHVGARLINDISAMQHDSTMRAFVAEVELPICLMHMRDRPQEMSWSHVQAAKEKYVYANVVDSVFESLARLKESAMDGGIRSDRLLLDIGLGFGKTVEQNFQLLNAISRFKDLDSPILVGASRKSFIGDLLKQPLSGRLAGSLGVASWCASQGVEVLRVHDVRETQDLLDTISKISSAKVV